MKTFRDLHKALRWLRRSRGKKQYEVAETAGITRPMLSEYETGKKQPTIETLDKILDALDAGLTDLHLALSVHQDGGESAGEDAPWKSERPRAEPAPTVEPRVDLYHLLDVDQPLPADQEDALNRILAGFHELVRLKIRELERLTASPGGDRFED